MHGAQTDTLKHLKTYHTTTLKHHSTQMEDIMHYFNRQLYKVGMIYYWYKPVILYYTHTMHDKC